MNVLSLGTDEHVFERGSAVRQRQLAYAREFGQLDIVVLSRRPYPAEHDAPLTLHAVCGSALGRLLKAYRMMKQATKPDVVTVQDPFEVGLIGSFVAGHFGVPLHVQVHTDLLSPEFSRSSFTNRVRSLLASFVLRRASRIRVVSERIKESVQRKYSPRAPITVLPIFVDVAKFSIAKPDAALSDRFKAFHTKLLVVSRLEPEKNAELAIRAFAEETKNDACLIVVGEGSAHQRLEALARTLHVSDRVFFEGAQDPAPYYALADLLLVPSKYEGYGLVIVEALAAGKPVLATDVGVAREAGAIISNERTFAVDLKRWLESGPRAATLASYPYRSFDEYVRAYCVDITACVK